MQSHPSETAHAIGLQGGGSVEGSPTTLGLQKNLPDILFARLIRESNVLFKSLSSIWQKETCYYILK